MKSKLLAVLMALSFAGGLAATSTSFAGDDAAKATKKACKGKKAGDMVKVDGKEVACPEKKKK